MPSTFRSTVNNDSTLFKLYWRSDHAAWHTPDINEAWHNTQGEYRITIRAPRTASGHPAVSFIYEAPTAASLLPRRGAASAAGRDAMLQQSTGSPLIRIVAAPGVIIDRPWPDAEAIAAERAAILTRPSTYLAPEMPILPPPAELLRVVVTRVQNEDEIPPLNVDLSGAGGTDGYRSYPVGFAPAGNVAPTAAVAALAVDVYPQDYGVIFYNQRDDRTVTVTVPRDSTDGGNNGAERFVYALDTETPVQGARLKIWCTAGVGVLIQEGRTRQHAATPTDPSFSVAVYEAGFAAFPRHDAPPASAVLRQREHRHELRGHDPQDAIDMVHLIFSVVPFTGDLVDIGDFVRGAFVDGRDLAGRPVSRFELALLGLCALLPLLPSARRVGAASGPP